MKDNVNEYISHTTIAEIAKHTKLDFEGSEKLNALIDEHIIHFKVDKWPITMDHIISEMLYALTGTDPIVYFVNALAKKKIHVGVGDRNGSMVFFLDKKKAKTKKKVAKKKPVKRKRK